MNSIIGECETINLQPGDKFSSVSAPGFLMMTNDYAHDGFPQCVNLSTGQMISCSELETTVTLVDLKFRL